MKLSFIMIALQFISTDAYPMNMLFVKDYLKFNDIRICVFLSCDNAADRIKNRIDFQHDDTWISWWGVSTESELRSLNYTNLLVRLSAPMAVIFNLECHNSKEVMEEISKRKMFHYERHWLLFGENQDQAYNILKNQFINVDAEILLALPTNQNDGYHIFEVFNPNALRGGKLNITQMGHWNSADGLSLSNWQTKIQKRHDLKQLWFHTAMAIPSVPINKTFIEHIESDEFPFMDSGDKMGFRMFQLIKNMFNFNVIVHRAHVWGILSANGSWKGVIDMLSRDEIDFAIPTFRWANERYSAFEHTTHIYHIQYVFTFLHPQSVDTSRVYLSPFNGFVWLLIILICIVISCAIRLSFWAENKMHNSKIGKIENENSYGNSILMVFGFIVQQGYSGDTLFMSSRILFATILLFSIVTFQFYSSFIVSSLLIEEPKTINTVQQLLHSDLVCYIDENANVRDHIEHFNEKSVIKLYNKITAQANPFVPLEKGVDLIKKGGNAFYTDGSHEYLILKDMLTDQEICYLHEVKYVQKVPGGPGVPKKSPLKELIKISLRRITEIGLLSYHWKIWIGHKPKCAKNTINVVPVDIVHFSSALYVCFVGVQISLCILLVEMFINRYLRCKIAYDSIQ